MNSVKIGHQEWSSENLNVDHFNNGDEIQQVESAEDWLKCLENKTPAWCYFDNNPDNLQGFYKRDNKKWRINILKFAQFSIESNINTIKLEIN